MLELFKDLNVIKELAFLFPFLRVSLWNLQEKNKAGFINSAKAVTPNANVKSCTDSGLTSDRHVGKCLLLFSGCLKNAYIPAPALLALSFLVCHS